MGDKLCIGDQIKALPDYNERLLAVRVMIEKGIVYNNGTLDRPIFLMEYGVCEKHPRGCSLGRVINVRSFYK
jgi:hypothetical protein